MNVLVMPIRNHEMEAFPTLSPASIANGCRAVYRSDGLYRLAGVLSHHRRSKQTKTKDGDK